MNLFSFNLMSGNTKGNNLMKRKMTIFSTVSTNKYIKSRKNYTFSKKLSNNKIAHCKYGNIKIHGLKILHWNRDAFFKTKSMILTVFWINIVHTLYLYRKLIITSGSRPLRARSNIP